MNRDTNTALATLEALETPVRDIDREALKRLDDEIAAKKCAEAEREAVESAKRAEIKKAEPEPAQAAPTIRKFLDSCTIKAGHAHILDGCRKYGISLDSPWPPKFPEEGGREPAPQPTNPTAKVVQLDFWEDGRRAAPNIMLRSSLFPALKFKEGRPFLKQKQLFTTKGGEVYFTGEQFDQSDLDVYLEILNFARPFPLGTPVRFSAYAMLTALGRNTGKSDHEWLHSVLIRLRGGTVDMTDHKTRYGGGLIYILIKDEITKEYEVIIDPRFAVLFGFGMWATLDKEQRRALGRNQTAKALHAFYSTHAAPGPHNFDTLADLIGLQNKKIRDVRANIIKAHEELKRVGFLSDYEASATVIKTAINHTPSQSRHIVKKIIKSRKRTRRNDE